VKGLSRILISDRVDPSALSVRERRRNRLHETRVSLLDDHPVFGLDLERLLNEETGAEVAGAAPRLHDCLWQPQRSLPGWDRGRGSRVRLRPQHPERFRGEHTVFRGTVPPRLRESMVDGRCGVGVDMKRTVRRTDRGVS
jgi:hypothetical protein